MFLAETLFSEHCNGKGPVKAVHFVASLVNVYIYIRIIYIIAEAGVPSHISANFWNQ